MTLKPHRLAAITLRIAVVLDRWRYDVVDPWSIRELARATRSRPADIAVALRDLEARGYVVRDPGPRGGTWRVNPEWGIDRRIGTQSPPIGTQSPHDGKRSPTPHSIIVVDDPRDDETLTRWRAELPPPN